MPVESKYRLMPAADLAALRVSLLTQIKQVEGVGQSHSANGRQTSQANLASLTNDLADVNAAIAWQAVAANSGNKGYASRFSCFNHYGQG